MQCIKMLLIKHNLILNASVCFSRFKNANNLEYNISQLQPAKSTITNVMSTDPTFYLEYDSRLGPRSPLVPVAHTVDSAHGHASENTSPVAKTVGSAHGPNPLWAETSDVTAVNVN